MTRIEGLSCFNSIPGFQGGTVMHTTVTKMEKKIHGFGHYSSYTFYPIWTNLLLESIGPEDRCFENTSKKVKLNTKAMVDALRF